MKTLRQMLRLTIVYLTLGALGCWSVWAQLAYRTPSRYVTVVLAGIAMAGTGLTLAVWLYAMFRGVGASEGRHDDGRGETDDLLAVASHLTRQYGDLSFVLAGFSFGSFVQTRVAKRLKAERMVLVGPAVSRFPAGTVPPDTLVIHGEHDDVVPLAAVLDWARPQGLPIVVVPGGEHFFHGRLNLLSDVVIQYFRPVAEI